MASRFAGAPDLTGHGPRASLSSASLEEGSRLPLEVCSADAGHRMVGVGRGVSHEFQRQMSPGQMPTMEACPENDVQWEWEERELLPLTAMESTVVRALDGIPKEAPTMEAWICKSGAAGAASMNEGATSEVSVNSEHGDSVETVGDDEVSVVANSAEETLRRRRERA